MSLNVSKTHMVVYSSANLKNFQTLSVDNDIFTRKSCVKLLGIWINDKLDFNSHCEHVLEKINQGVFNLN